MASSESNLNHEGVRETLHNLLVAIGKSTEIPVTKDLLANLKTAMGNLSRAEMADHMGNVNFESLFECLSIENK
jgi:hypothetical protein